MVKIFQSYSIEFLRCLSLKGEISNRRLLEYVIINYMVISAITSFFHGVYDGFNDVSAPYNWTIFIFIYAITTILVIVKRIKGATNS